MRKTAFFAVCAWAGTCLGQTPASGPLPDHECAPLPPPRPAAVFPTGEVLEYSLDALGAVAGKMTMTVLPPKEGTLPVEVRAETNTFFSNIRRVNGIGTSYLNPRNFHPSRYVEDATENNVRKYANVTFSPKDHLVRVEFKIAESSGSKEFHYSNDGLDVAGAIYLIRQLPLRPHLRLCFDVYGIRTLWRVTGNVGEKEHVSTPLGEFEAWHLSGVATRLDQRGNKREIHIWLTDDDRRLPLAAMGVIDLGAVRASLTGFKRPGSRREPTSKPKLKW